jgi:vesicle coat complex subunit
LDPRGVLPDHHKCGAELIESLFLDDFLEESTDVQHTILTTLVKFFMLHPEDGQEMFTRVLSFATKEVGNSDLNERHTCTYASS